MTLEEALARIATLAPAPAQQSETIQRPKSSNADEWAVFLEHWNVRESIGYLAVQIATAIDEAIATTQQVQPVAYKYRWKVDGEWTEWRYSDASQKHPALDLEEIPLYAAAPAQDWRPIESGWINIYESPPGASTVPCSCIWPTKDIADKNRLTTSPRKACVQVSWPSPPLAERKGE